MTQGTVTIFWTPVDDVAHYRVYKALPAHGNVIPGPQEQFGFVGFSYGTTFTDSNIVADFITPIQHNDPFAPSPIVGYNITNPGSGYTPEGTGITITDSTGSGAVIYPVLDNNLAGSTGA